MNYTTINGYKVYDYSDRVEVQARDYYAKEQSALVNNPYTQASNYDSVATAFRATKTSDKPVKKSTSTKGYAFDVKNP